MPGSKPDALPRNKEIRPRFEEWFGADDRERSPVPLRDDWAQVDAIILDRRLPDGTAEELLPRLRRLAPAAAILVVTGYADVQGAVAAMRLGAVDYLLKPISPDELRARLYSFAGRRRAEEEVRILQTVPAESPNPVLRVAQQGTLLYANASAAPL